MKNLETFLTHKLLSSEIQLTNGGNNNSCRKKGGNSWGTDKRWLTGVDLGRKEATVEKHRIITDGLDQKEGREWNKEREGSSLSVDCPDLRHLFLLT